MAGRGWQPSWEAASPLDTWLPQTPEGGSEACPAQGGEALGWELRAAGDPRVGGRHMGSLVALVCSAVLKELLGPLLGPLQCPSVTPVVCFVPPAPRPLR